VNEELQTIPELFERAVQGSPGATWLYYEDRQYSFAEADSEIRSAAATLAERGARRGDLILATMRNDPRYLFTWLAAMRIGAILVPVNPRSSAAEVEGLIAQTGPLLVISDPDLSETVANAEEPIDVTDLFAESGDPPPIAARADDPAVLIPTSGTTGRSKLVTQTQRAYTMAGEGFPYWMQLDSSDRLMTSLPLFHINAPAYSILGSVAAGAGVILLPRFSASGFLDAARRFGATEFNAIGAMLEILMNQPERPDDADNPLRLCYTGPSPTKERQLEIERRFGLEVVCGYGLSESPYALIWPRGKRPYGTLGGLRQHPRLGVVNEGRVVADGEVVGVGEAGELQLRNPTVMLGYWNMPDETEAVLSDGWLRTGDLVRLDDEDTYTFISRIKEVIRRRGENLAPAEVEAALAAHPEVVEAAVIGVPSALSEEEVKAFVVPVEGAAVQLDELREFISSRLTAFKVPRYLQVVDELPHTPTGRVAKHELPADLTGEEWDAEAVPR
jgi:crotonobetaine/carnitine-CoA ligase